MTQLDHFSSELFKIYLIGEEKAIYRISLKRLIPSFSQERAWILNILTTITTPISVEIFIAAESILVEKAIYIHILQLNCQLTLLPLYSGAAS